MLEFSVNYCSLTVLDSRSVGSPEFGSSELEVCLSWIPVPLKGWNLQCWLTRVPESWAQNGRFLH